MFRRAPFAAFFFTAASIALCQVPSWETLKKAYAYEYAEVKPKIVLKDAPKARVEDVSFSGFDGSTATGVFIRPVSEGRYPVVLLLHGLGGSKETMTLHLAQPLIDRGYAVFALDAPFHGERRTTESKKEFAELYFGIAKTKTTGDLFAKINAIDAENRYRKFLQGICFEGVLDYERALDYLITRPEVDPKRIGLFGYSFGSIMGSILAGIDSRVRVAVLGVGGDPVLPSIPTMPADFRDRAYLGACSLYVGHTEAPILMLVGEKDDVIGREASDRLYDAAGPAKSRKIYPTGHSLPEAAFQDGIEWLVQRLRA